MKSRSPLTWPWAIVFLVLLGAAWLIMQPFKVMLREGNPDEEN